jgi:hypothetical protein
MIDLLSMLTARERRLSAAGESAWDREARALIAIASAHGITLREDDLVYLDVRDLQALHWRVEHRHGAWHPQGPRAA